MKKYEIAALSEEELIKQIRESQQRLADVRFNKVIEPPQNPMIFRNLRKNIAKMKAALRQIEIRQVKEAKNA
ncbi:MAG: 50S ribosomal protein L29 [Chlorobiales bacterium]|jgi:large subunit ribosomal protein L29|nr:50S ribosomal protein L29 [Chlorobiales bacterium]